MKLHLALAGLALISPFATVAQSDDPTMAEDMASIGIDQTPPDVIVGGHVKADAGDPAQRGWDAYMSVVNGDAGSRLLTTAMETENILSSSGVTDSAFIIYGAEIDICGKTIRRFNLPCGAEDLFLGGFTPRPDSVVFSLSNSSIYTFSVTRITPCEFDTESVLFFVGSGRVDNVTKSDDVNPPPATCNPTAEFGYEPEIVFNVLTNGLFFLSTGSTGGRFANCPIEGYGYEIAVSCLSKDAERQGAQGGDTYGGGDPHFKTWRGERFSYHGKCDLVMFHDPEFESGLGLDVHIRTEIRRESSFIAFAALRIGKEILEVASQGVYWFNGVLNADLPKEFSGFAFSHTRPTEQQHVFDVHLGGRQRIKLKTYKDFVAVLVEWGHRENFVNSVGLMGDFQTGHMLARDGKTVMDNWNAYGQEWQVRDTDPSLFQTLRLPQHPNVCTLPSPKHTSQLRRRLAATSSDEQLAAEKACEHWGEGKDDCVFDVLATGDIGMAEVSGAY
jgi:hypothetical protein